MQINLTFTLIHVYFMKYLPNKYRSEPVGKCSKIYLFYIEKFNGTGGPVFTEQEIKNRFCDRNCCIYEDLSNLFRLCHIFLGWNTTCEIVSLLYEKRQLKCRYTNQFFCINKRQRYGHTDTIIYHGRN